MSGEESATDIPQPPESINGFVIAGDVGFQRVEGPFSVEKAGTKWTIIVPLDDRRPPRVDGQEGEAAVLIADCEAVGGGVVDVIDEPDGKGELHIVVDQYARGDPDV